MKLKIIILCTILITSSFLVACGKEEPVKEKFTGFSVDVSNIKNLELKVGSDGKYKKIKTKNASKDFNKIFKNGSPVEDNRQFGKADFNLKINYKSGKTKNSIIYIWVQGDEEKQFFLGIKGYDQSYFVNDKDNKKISKLLLAQMPDSSDSKENDDGEYSKTIQDILNESREEMEIEYTDDAFSGNIEDLEASDSLSPDEETDISDEPEEKIVTPVPIQPPKQSQPKQSQPKQSQPKQSQPKQSQPKQSQPKQSQPKQSQPKQSQPKQSQPKPTQPGFNTHDKKKVEKSVNELEKTMKDLESITKELKK